MIRRLTLRDELQGESRRPPGVSGIKKSRRPGQICSQSQGRGDVCTDGNSGKWGSTSHAKELWVIGGGGPKSDCDGKGAVAPR